MDIDVEVSSGIDHLGRDHAHRAVAGREGLVEHRHDTADGRFPLDHMHLESAVGEIQGCLHTSYSAAYNQHGAFLVGLSLFCFVGFIAHNNPNPLRSEVDSTK
jgi:hypothetical protein